MAIFGSGRSAVPDATLLQKSDPGARIKISIFARRNPNPSAAVIAKASAITRQPVGQRTYLSHREFDQLYGAAPADLAKIERFAKAAKLTVVDASVSKRRVLVEGAIADLEKAFGVQLNDFDHEKLGKFRGREGKIYVPEALFSLIVDVEGLDTRPAGRPRRVRTQFEPAALNGAHAASAFTNRWPGTFFPPQVASLYDYPAEFDGTGQNFAIFAFNSPTTQGGYSLPALQTYFETVLGGNTPAITDVVVQGPGNDPGPDTRQSQQRGDATGEVMLDLCVAGSVAPGAHIFVYFTEFSNQGWIEALNEAITDNNDISVISISYGNPEDDPNSLWTVAGVKLVNETLEAASSKGVTICCASGDDGSSDGGNIAEADFPASSPWVLGVGGTSLKATEGANPQIASEVVWNDLNQPQPEGSGGGGVSAVFSLPAYQQGANVPPSANPPHLIGRGVPDVAAVADPNTGVVVMHINGKAVEPIGGTSAAAPLWASLLVRINQGLGSRIGFLNPTLYASCATGVLNDITVGNNGAYRAGPGWDACTGFGSPDGSKLLHALKNAPAPS
ncbi:MAG TPA: S53 family serine peptidase [Xanthobacteraceae bacterium]|nr:S53 family serine peptidase [Xanthobacteraceae bacterium]